MEMIQPIVDATGAIETELTIASAIAITIFLTQVVKESLRLDSNRFVPLIVLLFGMLISMLFGLSVRETVVTGLVISMAAVGSYETVKTLRGR